RAGVQTAQSPPAGPGRAPEGTPLRTAPRPLLSAYSACSRAAFAADAASAPKAVIRCVQQPAWQRADDAQGEEQHGQCEHRRSGDALRCKQPEKASLRRPDSVDGNRE